MIERWQRAKVLERPTQTWWDARIHPALGTLEFRSPDQPTDGSLAAGFVALLHALGVWAALEDGPPASRADYHTNRFFASRFGPRARLLHPYEDRVAPVTELYEELRELVAPHAEEDLLAAIDPGTCEADQLLACGDAMEACRDALSRSLASPA
jgi:gamma-glutamyl:cysteine ligase YbdK (ATP-grasp superfamily)